MTQEANKDPVQREASMAPRVLLIGLGYAARALARRLLARGVDVIATSRRGPAADDELAKRLSWLQLDPSETDGAARLRAQAERATHILSSVPPGGGQSGDGEHGGVERWGGDPVLPALEGAALERCWIGYLSTTGVYGDRKGGWAFEEEPATPGQPRSQRRAEAEAGWSDRGARLFRLSGIYGPGRSALDRVRAGAARAIVKPGHVFSRIHVDDIASALERAMLDRSEAAGAFNLADDAPSAQAMVLETAAALLGLPPPVTIAFEEAELSAMAASFYAECRRVSNARSKAALGWRPAYPSWREGLAATLERDG